MPFFPSTTVNRIPNTTLRQVPKVIPAGVVPPPNQQPWQVPKGIPAIVLPTPSQLLPLTDFYEPLFFMDVLSFK